MNEVHVAGCMQVTPHQACAWLILQHSTVTCCGAPTCTPQPQGFLKEPGLPIRILMPPLHDLESIDSMPAAVCFKGVLLKHTLETDRWHAVFDGSKWKVEGYSSIERVLHVSPLASHQKKAGCRRQ
jgi:hypothetical protein